MKRVQNGGAKLIRHQSAMGLTVGCCSLTGTGWPQSMYGVSKLCEATYTRVLAEQLRQRNISVNACCPGCVHAGS